MRIVERWGLALYALGGVLSIALWVGWGLATVGRARLSHSTVLVIAGFAGGAVLGVAGTAVVGLVLLIAIGNNRVTTHAEIRAVVRRLEQAGHLPELLIDDATAGREARRLAVASRLRLMSVARQRKAGYDATQKPREAGEQEAEHGGAQPATSERIHDDLGSQAPSRRRRPARGQIPPGDAAARGGSG